VAIQHTQTKGRVEIEFYDTETEAMIREAELKEDPVAHLNVHVYQSRNHDWMPFDRTYWAVSWVREIVPHG